MGEPIRTSCEREVPIQEQRAQNLATLRELKAHVRELENDLVKVIEDLATSEEKANQEIKDKEDIQEIISWYKRVLGLRIEGGRGELKVIFNNVNLKDPNEEYSFTILLAHDTHTLLNCDPHLDGTNELIQELNQTNAIFKFVRVMRKKFKASASSGSQSQLTSTYPVSSLVSASAPASPVSVDRNESLRKEITQVQDEEVIRTPEEVICGRQSRSPKSVGRSPGSASSVRRNYRSKATCRRISPGSASSNSSVYIICSPQLAHKGKERCNLKQRGFTIKSQMISSIH